MTDTPRTDEAFATYSTLTLLICSRELEIENATLRSRIAELEEWRPMETAPDEYCLVAYDSGLHLVTNGMESDQVVGEYGTPICWLPLPSPKEGGES